MRATGSYDEGKVAAACAALAPYGWRSLTPERLAGFVIAACDREQVRSVIDDLPGARSGAWAPLAPAVAEDPRLPGLVAFLNGHGWSGLSLDALCRSLLERLARDEDDPENAA
jgi:hypothetical protein